MKESVLRAVEDKVGVSESLKNTFVGMEDD
jgi:hypothetical protein